MPSASCITFQISLKTFRHSSRVLNEVHSACKRSSQPLQPPSTAYEGKHGHASSTHSTNAQTRYLPELSPTPGAHHTSAFHFTSAR
ncbi:Transmembrane channel-like protein 8 [Clarias magur]|uniref:Transmembrane channel-like protein 8 n=1 Tax=Clarias magur TaxID=1594786 RepID=A0A8J4XET3_CLAMG|nr:Transmembrane channel-like protein 8 [Clarias magur]